MKKAILIPLTILLLTSCAGPKLLSKIESEDKDSFKEESFLRYSSARLNKLNEGPYSSLASCHNGDVSKGLKELQRQLKEKEKEPSYWNQVGMCYFLKRHYSKAEFYFQMSLDLSRNRYAPAMNNLGVIKLQKRFFQDALKNFNNAKRRDKSLATPNFNKAQVYLKFNLPDKALRELSKLDTKDQNDIDVNLALASSYLLKNNISKSLSYLKKIPKYGHSREDIALMRAMSLYLKNDFYEAKKALEEQKFTRILPIKKSSQKLMILITEKIKELEELEKKKDSETKKVGRQYKLNSETLTARIASIK
jgi:tetratricopeptide (TPR) repeat protein